MEHDAGMRRDSERQEIILDAVLAGDQILIDAADGSQERLDNLTSELVIYMMLARTNRIHQSVFFEKEVLARAYDEIYKTIDVSSYSVPVLTYLISKIIDEFVQKANNSIVKMLDQWDRENPV